jgi:hypothetical protein
LKVERWLLALTPAVALATVALGLRLGAPRSQRGAVVYAAPAPLHAPTRASSLFVFGDEGGSREPLELLPLQVVARTAKGETRWLGVTDDDGVAEVVLPVGLPPSPTRLTVTTGSTVLASGDIAEQPPSTAARPPAPWMPFVRREGPIVIDAALVGERAAPGFPATIWVHATARETGKPVARATIQLEGDESLTPPMASGTTDAAGWASLVTTPVGLALTVTIHARGQPGSGAGPETPGEWVGPFPMAPGAARIETRARWKPDEEIEIVLTEPIAWRDAYVEVDDARGRAWATTASRGVPRPDGGVMLGVHVPPLAAGLYWAVASAAPFGGTEGETRTAYRAFFVARSDDAALGLGTDVQACTGPADAVDAERTLGRCLALSARTPVERWLALDGFAGIRARDAVTRARGLRIALGGLLVAALLEAALLLGGAARARVRLDEEGRGNGTAGGMAASRAWTVTVTVLVALLGFALLAAFLSRVS